MEIPKRIRLIPHHLAYIIEDGGNYKRLYENLKGSTFPEYTEKSIERIIAFLKELSEYPDTEIEIVSKSVEDYICNLCDNLNDGKWKCKKPDNDFDERVLKSGYGLSVGEIRTVKELKEYSKQKHFPAAEKTE